MLDRRLFASQLTLALASYAIPGAIAAQPFWNRKDPDSWTSDELLQLATRSPWATKARVLPRPRKDKGHVDGALPEAAAGNAGGRGTGPIPIIEVADVTVVWASAKPLMDALRPRFPPDFANHYVINVLDLPANPGEMLATLSAKGKEPVGAGGMDSTRRGTLFAFSKELLPLSPADKEAIFTLEASQFSVRARFDLKEMVYQGMLAV